MVRVVLLLALAVIGPVASAGPLRRNVSRSSATTCSADGCGNEARSSVRTVTRGSGAQAHADSMASRGVLVHASSHGATYEGIGVGSSPEAALSSCCNNGGTILEEGTAYGHGRWYAVRRYSLR
jgi:hypothetical protein